MSIVSNSSVLTYTLVCNMGRGTFSQNITLRMTNAFLAQLQFCSFVTFLSSLPAAILNILVIIAISKSSTLQTHSNILIFSLSVTDAITGGISLPMYGALLYKQSQYEEACLLGYISYQFSAPLAVISIGSVSGIALERYVAIFHPYFYQSHVTKRRILIGISLVWIIVILIHLISFGIGSLLPSTSFSGIMLTVGLIWNAIVYIKIFKLVKRLRQNQVRNNPDPTMTVENLSQQESGERRLNAFTTVIIGVITFSYLPFLIAKFVKTSLMVDNNLKQLVETYTNVILLVNSLMNPIVYLVQNPSIKRAVMALMKSPTRNTTQKKLPQNNVKSMEWHTTANPLKSAF